MLMNKNVAIMPKGRFPKLEESTCNVPYETADITNTFDVLVVMVF